MTVFFLTLMSTFVDHILQSEAIAHGFCVSRKGLGGQLVAQIGLKNTTLTFYGLISGSESDLGVFALQEW